MVHTELMHFDEGKIKGLKYIVYPITYKNKRYYIEFKQFVNNIGYIAGYEYNEKSRLFNGHIGDKVFQLNTPIIFINDEEYDIREMDYNEFLINLPKIMNGVFRAYEKDLKIRLKAKLVIEEWDGKVG